MVHTGQGLYLGFLLDDRLADLSCNGPLGCNDLLGLLCRLVQAPGLAPLPGLDVLGCT